MCVLSMQTPPPQQLKSVQQLGPLRILPKSGYSDYLAISTDDPTARMQFRYSESCRNIGSPVTAGLEGCVSLKVICGYAKL